MKKKGPLFLTKFNHKKPVVIQSQVVETLTQYHIDGIRFLYQQCISKDQNVVLNNDPDMNEERQICVFLSAIDRPIPSLIACPSDRLMRWYYEFSQFGLKVTTANDLIKDNSWEDSSLPDAVLLTHDQLKHLKSLPIESWFFYVVQNLECLDSSRYIKNVDSDYRIGILDQSFADLNQELQWFTMKWANSHLVEEKDKFIEADNFKMSNLLWPFPDYWRRITWDTVKNFKPSDEEFEEYNEKIKIWCRENKPSLLPSCNPVEGKQSKKRTATKKPTKTNKRPTKRGRISKKKMKEVPSDSDSDVEKKVNRRAINYSSDSDIQEGFADIFSNEDKKNSPGKDNVIQNEAISTSTATIIKDNRDESSSNNNFILNSLHNYSEPSSSKYAPKNLELKEIESELDNNYILDSLIDSSSKPSTSKREITREIKVFDDEIESCPILDSLL